MISGVPREQRRSRRIAMSPEEVDAYLAEQRVCRVASVGRDGAPHNTPLWFVWNDGSLFLFSIVGSQRWTDVIRDSRVSVIVDDGDAYGELRGVELIGSLAPVGDVPRTDAPEPALVDVERAFGDKYHM